MTNPHFTTIEQYRDIESHNAYEKLTAQGESDAEALTIFRTKVSR